MDSDKLYQQLTERRDVLGITQTQLADISGVSLRNIRAIERGKGNPTVATLTKLADVMGLNLTLTIKPINNA